MKNRKQLVSIAVVLLLVIAMFFFMRKEPYITPESTCMNRDAPDWCRCYFYRQSGGAGV
jgi:hypothetical protein